MIKELPLITEEELREMSQPQEEFIAEAIKLFNEEADKIDEQYDRGSHI